MVCFIHRPEYYKIYKDQNGNPTKGMAEFIIAKHRNGEVRDVRMRFQSEYARFSDINDTVIPLPTEDGTIKQSKVNSHTTKMQDEAFDSISDDMAPLNDSPF